MPLRAWWSAMERDCMAAAEVFEWALDNHKSMHEAVAWLRKVSEELTALEPAVEAIFSMAGISVARATEIPSLRDLTSSYVRSQHDRGGDSTNELAARLASAGLKLPPEIETMSHTDFAGL